MHHRLLDFQRGTGQVLLQVVAQPVDDLLARPAGLLVDTQDVLRGGDRHGVFIQLGPTGAADEGAQLPVGVARGHLHPSQLAINEGGAVVETEKL